MSKEKTPGIFKKMLEASDAFLEGYIQKSKIELEKAQPGISDDDPLRHSLYLPPHSQFKGSGYREKRTKMGYNTLRLMSYRDSIIAAILQTRLNQVASFSSPQPDKYHPGFIIELRDTKDGEKLDKEDEKNIKILKDFITNCGIIQDRPANERCTFDTFLRKIIRDRLTFDQIAFEFVYDKKRDLHHFVPVDASTIRIANVKYKRNWKDIVKHLAEGDNKIDLESTEAEEDPEKTDYVQVINEQIMRSFSRNELAVRFGNPVNDIYANGYSVGELELLINIVTAHIYAENYNRLFFTQGHVTKGLLHLEAQIPQRQLEAFKQQWYAQTSGNVNSWRTPIIAGDHKVNWVTLNPSSKDMEFHNWLSYLIKIACAIYQISPSEIGFDISKDHGTGGGGGGLFESSNEARIKHSKDKGLRPLLRFIEDLVNDEILSKIDIGDRYCFRIVGLDADTQSQEVERNKTEIQTFRTVDEVRADHGLEGLGEEGGGHLILDSNYVQWLSQFGKIESEKNKQIQAQQPPGPGEPAGEQTVTPEGEEEEVEFSKSANPKLLKIEYWKK